MKPKPDPVAEAVTAARLEWQRARSVADETRLLQTEVEIRRLEYLTAYDAVLGVSKTVDRFRASATLFDRERRTLLGWVESITSNGDRVEHPALVPVESPAQFDIAHHALIETFRALSRRLEKDLRRQEGAAKEYEARYWRAAASQIEKSISRDVLTRIGAWAIAADRAGDLPEGHALTDLPLFRAGAEMLLDQEFGLHKLEETT